MKKKVIAIVLMVIVAFQLFGIRTFAQLPIEGGSEKDVIYGPKDYIYNKYLKKEEPFMKYCFSGERMGNAISITEGTVQSVQYSFNPNFYMTYGFASYEEAVKSLKKNNVDTKYISMTVCIALNKTEKVYYIGIEPGTANVTKGQEVKKGSYLGKIGYGIKDVPEKSLTVSYEVGNKLGDIEKVISNFTNTSNNDSVENQSEEIKEKKSEEKINRENQKSEIDYREDYLSIDELDEIYAIFYQSLMEGHPSLYAYTDKEQLDTAFKELKSKLSQPLRRNELFLHLNEIIHLVKDNHTYIAKSYLSNEDMAYDIPYDLPVKLGFINGKCYVLDIYKDLDQLNIGDEITAINGEAIEIVSQKLKRAAGTADGNIKGFSDIYLLKESPSLGSGFKYLYDIVYRPKLGDPFVMETDHGKISFTLESLEIPEKSPGDYQYVEVNRKGDTLILGINTMYLTDEHFKTVEEALTAPDAENIIIDLRKNMGGSDESVEKLFQMLYDGSFIVEKRYEVRSNESYEFNKYALNLTGEIACFADYLYDETTNDYYIDWTTHPDEFAEIQGKNLCEDKRIYVLTSELTGSAATVLSNLIQYHKIGLVLGREGSGAIHHMNALKFSKIRLGESGLILQVPLVKIIPNYVASDVEYGRGVIPDIIIPYSLEEEIGDDDLTLATALEYVNSAKQEGPNRMKKGILIGVGLCAIIGVCIKLKVQ